MKFRWGAIFDWDGVIVDSSRQHKLSWELLAQEIKLELVPDFFKISFGMKNEKIIPEILGWTQDPEKIVQLSLRKEALYREIIAREGISALPGVESFLAALHTHGIPRVIASSTHRLNIIVTLTHLKLDQCFSDIVSSEDVIHGKPNPQVFQLAAERIQMPPENCIVFEDAMVGVEAARAAGMKVVALTTSHPAEKLKNADLIIENLSHASISQFEFFFKK